MQALTRHPRCPLLLHATAIAVIDGPETEPIRDIRVKLLVQGAAGASDVPGLDQLDAGIELAFAKDAETLRQHLPGTDALLGWDFRGRDLEECWDAAGSLKWIHWCGAGVDAVLFDGLRNSDVILTNSRGIFDRAMAEYVLGYLVSEVKLFWQTYDLQRQNEWKFRLTSKLSGQSALIFGVGSIGREIARVLKAMDMSVAGVGRTARSGDADFGEIHALGDATAALSAADWVIAVMPGTPETQGIFDARMFAAMKPTARFVNVGRGTAVDEAALVYALENGTIAGAMLDVFRTEPLPAASPLWQTPNLFLSPHMSGDYRENFDDLATLFLHNLARYRDGQPLRNVVDKALGFVST